MNITPSQLCPQGLSDFQENPHSQVLIVDGSVDSCEVIQTALQHRGVCSTTARSKKQGIESARQDAPRVIVLDIESLPDGQSGCQDLVLMAKVHDSSIVWVGDGADGPLGSESHRIRKPYHYAALLHKIEDLLARDATSQGIRKAA